MRNLLTLLFIFSPIMLFTSPQVLAKTKCCCQCTPCDSHTIPPEKPEPTEPEEDRSYYSPTSIKLKDPKKLLPEISGIASSAIHSDVAYAHNDSGGSPRVYAINLKSGSIISRIDFVSKGIYARDWEDMTVGPCSDDPKSSCMYVADFGDNGKRRKDYAIYEAHEPNRIRPYDESPAIRHPFSYPKGKSFNAEAFFYSPLHGKFYIITKGPSMVYRLDGEEAIEICKLTGLQGRRKVVTGADMHPTRPLLLVRTYGAIFEYKVNPDGSVNCKEPHFYVDHKEKQGEAITYVNDGRGFITISEGREPEIFRFHRK